MPSPKPDPRLLVLIAAHNRREKTVASIAALRECTHQAQVSLTVYLADDGSTDGTAAAVLQESAGDVAVITGDGTWFWAKSMSRAEREALDKAQPTDWLLWLNDDVVLDNDAVTRLLHQANLHPGRIIVGSTRDPISGTTSYGGAERIGRHPLAFSLAEAPDRAATEVPTFNGNIVLVPVQLAHALGGIDGSFAHAMADTDYGLRAAQLGVPPLLAPGTFGTCARNVPVTYRSVAKAWRGFRSSKGGGEPRGTARLLRKTAPRTWLLWWAGTYVKWWARTLTGRNPALQHAASR